jgi:hypothetical protein
VKNWRKYCEEFGYNPYITFGRSRDEKVEMTEALIGWIQWNTERRRERGKNAGEKAMKSADSFNSYLASVVRATKELGEEWAPTGILERVMLRVKRIKSNSCSAKIFY